MKNITDEDIISAIPYKDVSDLERKLIRKSCAFAKEKHRGQKRKGGNPFYTHAFEVARLTAMIGLPSNSIAAACLHDVVEDTDTTIEEIEERFGKEVAFFVDALTNIEELVHEKSGLRIKSTQRLFVATSKDVRVMVIKLMDRLHNMRTLSALPKKNQINFSKETKKVFVPIADRLGMSDVKSELEDLSFKHMEPEKYERINSLIHKDNKEIEEFEKKIKEKLKERKIKENKYKITSRVKTVYSVYEKIVERKSQLKDLHDIFAVRILTKDVNDAYKICNIIKKNFNFTEGRYKDFIKTPKTNGYKAIHSVVNFNKSNIEIQIMTEEMYNDSRFGKAAHFNYKDKRHGIVGLTIDSIKRLLYPKEHSNTEWLDVISQIYEKDIDADVFMEDIDTDFLQNRFFAFTKDMEAVDLPVGATTLDFAYAIHSDLGNKFKKAYVNGKEASMDTKLKNMDIVKIETSDKETVNKKWLSIPRTAKARYFIRKSF